MSDIRDSKTYTVRKMADGNCWMAENLKLDLTAGVASTAADFSGGTVSWTPNSGSGDMYNTAINGNYHSNVNGGNWYYPWYAATAGSGTQTASPTINRSICPQGWRLPDGNTSTKSFYNLITAKYGLASSSAGVNSLKVAPLSFIITGYYSSHTGSSVLYGSSNGYYWSAIPNTSGIDYAYILRFDTSSIDPQNRDGFKTTGCSVRCISI